MKMSTRSGVPTTGSFLLLCLVLSLNGLVTGSTEDSCSALSSTPCPVEQERPSSTERRLRNAIFDADTQLAAKILNGNGTFGLGAGLRYLEEQECAVVCTKNRTQDPDIVAIQAIALSARDNGEAEKLANAIVVSFELACDCSLFDSTERDRMAGAFRAILEDDGVIESILEYEGRSARTGSTETRGRRLHSTENSPTNSFVCAYCDPPSACNGVVNWCP